MDKYKNESSRRIDELFENATTVDIVKVHQEIQKQLEEQEKENKRKELAEFKRIDQMECPVCKSNDKARHRLMNDNGIMGPGYSSHVILEFYICNTCGVHYSDLKKKNHVQ
jgi:C4-type Zn-finger protein